jgi:serine phosphatase RsbU (regulator of sigma subunit)/CHASE3 domain sensor protein
LSYEGSSDAPIDLASGGAEESVGFSRQLSRTAYSPVYSLGALVLGLLGLVAVLLSTMRWLDHSDIVLQRGLYAQKLLLDVQTSVRGYDLSGDRAYLEPAERALPLIRPALDEILELVRDNPSQLRAAREVDSNASAFLALARDSLAHVDAGAGEKPSKERMARGKVTSDSLRASIDVFLGNEYDLGRLRSRQVTMVTWWALGFAALATGGTAYVQCRGMRRRLIAIADTYSGALVTARQRRDQVQALLKELDQELQAVGEIQRSLLPMQLPSIHGVEMAAAYQTSRRAGGDYYDFFRLPPERPGDDRVRYGILIADVSGHGTPAAVLMAVTHSIAHGFAQPAQSPDAMLAFVNRRLCQGYITPNAAFVTAFYAIYNPRTRELIYSSAGHNPPRLRRAGASSFEALNDAQSLPLGVEIDEPYETRRRTLGRGDTLVLYTDGITEARSRSDELFGTERLDEALMSSGKSPSEILAATLAAVERFDGNVVHDDRSILILHVLDRGEEPAQALVDVQFTDLSAAAEPVGSAV